MKKIIVFFIVAMVVFGACSAQKAEAQSANIAQKIIGTWVSIDGKTTWVFNANGTAKIPDIMSMMGDTSYVEAKFIVMDTILACTSERNTFTFNIAISSDGKTLILSAGPLGGGFWLTKK
jgi:hypothetical protein